MTDKELFAKQLQLETHYFELEKLNPMMAMGKLKEAAKVQAEITVELARRELQRGQQ